VRNVLSELLVAPGEALLSELQGSIYLSSQREIPDRSFAAPKAPCLPHWWNGLAAWETIILDQGWLLADVNRWLSSQDCFNSGHQIEVARYAEVEVGTPFYAFLKDADPADDVQSAQSKQDISLLPEHRRLHIRHLATGTRLSPRDVGVGMSQAIPIIVAALRGASSVTAIEEPEARLHPAFQVVLADLFLTRARRVLSDKQIEAIGQEFPHLIDSFKGKVFTSWFLIETHSEHLLLRCLRRIRETSAGQLGADAPTVAPDDVAVHFVEPSERGTVIHRIRLDKDGEFMDPWPRGFFPERMKEVYGDDL
jgi:hypothetical protein